MNPEAWLEVDSLFAQALDLSAAERAALLERTGIRGQPIRAEVENLLAADRQAEGFLEIPAALASGLVDDDPAVAGLQLGPYRIERVLGRGGMGTVVLAQRDDGRFERQVAIKILRQDAIEPGGIERFRTERRILARLEHPAIARLYDGGETAQGVPYLVMEHIEGLAVDAYCDRHRLGVRARLELFRRLLEAVSYAHQHLLVHRDIKPQNILVTAQGEPKLLDFGIATDLAGPQPLGSTSPQRLAMTPRYASPEQIRGEAITTATDVYGLGVVLYELLSGRGPYRPEDDSPRALEEAILHQHAARPSQALDGVPARREAEPTAEQIGAARGASARELRRRLQGDLDSIVLKAIRKEASRRYRSVLELAADLDRYLGSLPVSARLATPLYRTKKFARRHRLGMLAATAMVAILATSFLGVVRERRRAAGERDKARASLVFLVDLFEHADPYQKGGENLLARDVLHQGAERALRELGGEPEVQASLLAAIGKAEVGLGRIEEAEPLLGKALALRREIAADSLVVAESLESLAWARFLRSEYEAAEGLYREALVLRQRLQGSDSVAVAATLNLLGVVLTERYQSTDEARSRAIESLHREALEIYRRREGPEGPGVADSLFRLAKVLKDRGELAAAEGLMRACLRLHEKHKGTSHPVVAMAQRMLALILIDQANFAEARELLESALAIQRQVLPTDHPDLALTRNDLGLSYFRSGDYAAAEPLYREALESIRVRFGEAHAHTAIAMSNLAGALQNQGELEEAAALHERALALKREKYGEEHVYVAQSLSSLARLRSDQGRHPEALGLARRSFDINTKLLAPDHPELAWPQRSLGQVLLQAGRPKEAEPYLRRSLERLRGTLPAGSFQIARGEVLLGSCLAALGRSEEADGLLEQGLKSLESRFSPDHPFVRDARARKEALKSR